MDGYVRFPFYLQLREPCLCAMGFAKWSNTILWRRCKASRSILCLRIYHQCLIGHCTYSICKLSKLLLSEEKFTIQIFHLRLKTSVKFQVLGILLLAFCAFAASIVRLILTFQIAGTISFGKDFDINRELLIPTWILPAKLIQIWRNKLHTLLLEHDWGWYCLDRLLSSGP